MKNESFEGLDKSGVESVWDYPRPPRLEPSRRRVRIVQGGVVLVDSMASLRILETSHPPVYYIPPADIAMEHLRQSSRGGSFCEFKGVARYWSIAVPGAASPDAAWSYAEPALVYRALRGHLAFYAGRVDECYVDEERVVPQEGDFYGGWITSWVKGPFKGAPGTRGW